MAFPWEAAASVVASNPQLFGGALGHIKGRIDQHSQNVEDEKMWARRDAEITRAENFQREFAQMGVRWRADDARAAGFHPLAALGVNPASGSPAFSNSPVPEGQSAARSVQATSDFSERLFQALQLERASLENDLLRVNISRINASQLNPPRPDEDVQPQPLKPTRHNPGRKHSEVGSMPSYGFADVEGGGLRPSISDDYKQRLEDSPMEWVEMFLGPVMGALSGYNPPDPERYPLPPGYRWEWKIHKHAWFPVRDDGKEDYSTRMGRKYQEWRNRRSQRR